MATAMRATMLRPARRKLATSLPAVATRHASTTSSDSLIPRYGQEGAVSSGRIRPKLRSVDSLPPRVRGPPAIEDTWVMRFGDTVWYLIFGSLFGIAGYAIYEAVAGVIYRYKKGKSWMERFPPDERPEQYMSPQSPFNLESEMQPNEAYPFVMQDKSMARKVGEYPRQPPLLEKMLQADTYESRQKLAQKREAIAAEMRAKRDSGAAAGAAA